MKIWRLILLTAIIFGLAALVQILAFGPVFTLDSISDATFVVGIIIFLPSLIVVTGANQVFHGMGYVLRLLFSKIAKNEFPTYSDYKEHKTNNRETSFFKELLIASSIVFAVGIITALIFVNR